jgi:putative transposase
VEKGEDRPMPRGNRHHLAGCVWHITERCHRKQFLLKFARDRRAWVAWLYQARKRFGLCVLNYQVACNQRRSSPGLSVSDGHRVMCSTQRFNTRSLSTRGPRST